MVLGLRRFAFLCHKVVPVLLNCRVKRFLDDVSASSLDIHLRLKYFLNIYLRINLELKLVLPLVILHLITKRNLKTFI